MQLPLHAPIVSPATAPNVPGAHMLLHDAFVSPAELPNSPAAHNVHTADPATLYWPAGQITAVAITDPVEQ